MKLLTLGLLLITCNSHAAWVGKLDLNSSVQAVVIREIGDGQWLAGMAHPNLWHMDHNGNPVFHAGLFQVWNAEHGNASIGLSTGVDLMGASKEIGFDIPMVVGKIGDALKVPTLFKPAVWFAAMTSIDLYGGYRPVHTQDVKHNWIYGIGAALKVPFGVGELQGPNSP